MNIQLRAKIASYVAESSLPPRIYWGQIDGNINDQQDLAQIIAELRGQISAINNSIELVQSDIIELGASKAEQSVLSSHILNTENPHRVIKSQLGLENVDNTADLTKPISTATQAALDLKQDRGEI